MGLWPAVEPGILPGGFTSANTKRETGRQDAALYGSQDGRRYSATVSGMARLRDFLVRQAGSSPLRELRLLTKEKLEPLGDPMAGRLAAHEPQLSAHRFFYSHHGVVWRDQAAGIISR